MSMPEDTANYGDSSGFDFQRVSHLLHVVEKTRDYPKLKKIHDAAMKELEEHANPSEPDQTHVEEPEITGEHFKGETIDHTEESEPALRRSL